MVLVAGTISSACSGFGGRRPFGKKLAGGSVQKSKQHNDLEHFLLLAVVCQ